MSSFKNPKIWISQISLILLVLNLITIELNVIRGQNLIYNEDVDVFNSVYRVSFEKLDNKSINVVVKNLSATGQTAVCDTFNILSFDNRNTAIYNLNIKNAFYRLIKFNILQADKDTLNAISSRVTNANPLRDVDKMHLLEIVRKYASTVNVEYNSISELINFVSVSPTDQEFINSLDEIFEYSKGRYIEEFQSKVSIISSGLFANAKLASLSIQDTSISIGTATLHDSIYVYAYNYFGVSDTVEFDCFESNIVTEAHMEIDSLVVEFYEGAIKDIILFANMCGQQVLFQNTVPISFSSKRDIITHPIRTERNRKLYCFKYYFGNGRFYCHSTPYVYTNEIVDYARLLNMLTEDYSPGNQIITMYPDGGTKVLKKERTFQIIDAKIFTDIVGLEDDQPNGLVQFEIGKKIILNSRNIIPFGKSENAWRNAVNNKAKSFKLLTDKQLLLRNDTMYAFKKQDNINLISSFRNIRNNNSLNLNGYFIIKSNDYFASPQVKIKPYGQDVYKMTLNGASKLQYFDLHNIQSDTGSGAKFIKKGKMSISRYALEVYSDTMFTNLSSCIISGQHISMYNNRNSKYGNRYIPKFSYVNIFNYVTPTIKLAKLEDKVNILFVERIDSIFTAEQIEEYGIDDTLYTSPLRLYQYANFMGGGTLGLFDYTAPGIKSKFSVWLEAYIVRTKIQQQFKVNNEQNVNSVLLSPSFGISINPETRYEVSLFYKFSYIDAMFDRLAIFSNKDLYARNMGDHVGLNKWYHTFGFMGTLRTNLSDLTDSRIFIRGSFSFEDRNVNQNYLQVQIGYSFNILKRG